MGRHGGSVDRSGPSGPVIVVLCLVLAAAVGTVVVWTRTASSGGAVGAAAVPSVSSASSGAALGSGIRSGTTSSRSSASPSDSRTALTPQEAFEACRAEVTAADGVARAAAAAARDWRSHVDVQLRLDRGAISAAAAQDSWARTKARGHQDVERFAAARSALTKVAGACRADLATTYGTPWADKTAFCSTRNDALAGVVSTGTKVERQWRDHLDVVGGSTHRVGSLGSAWTQEVRAAQPALAAYDRAVKDLGTAPSCPS